MQTNMVMITKEEYEKLLETEMKLIALESAGVDNWQGYSDAMDILEEMRSEEEEE